MSQPPLTGPRSRPRGNSTPSCETSSMSAFLIFVGINRFWAARLLLERRSVQLTEDEQRLRQFCFPLLNPADVARLCRMGTWEHIEAGTCLNTTGCWRASR